MSFNNEAERLADALTEYGEAFDDGPGMFAEAAALLRSQAAELARREVDAERYRWLRETPVEVYGRLGHYTRDALDAAIDAARAAAPAEGEQA